MKLMPIQTRPSTKTTSAVIGDNNAVLPPVPIAKMVYDELSYISSNADINSHIMARMEPFIASLDFDSSIYIELTNENEKTVSEIIPVIQDLQTRFQSVISSLITERILFEMENYHALK